MNGKPRFLVYGVSVAEWTKRYGVEPFSHPCYECGRVLSTSIPFVQGTLRGLQAPQCECGHPNPPYAMVRDPAYGDLFTGREK
jgi:hypothetical protein